MKRAIRFLLTRLLVAWAFAARVAAAPPVQDQLLDEDRNRSTVTYRLGDKLFPNLTSDFSWAAGRGDRGKLAVPRVWEVDRLELTLANDLTVGLSARAASRFLVLDPSLDHWREDEGHYGGALPNGWQGIIDKKGFLRDLANLVQELTVEPATHHWVVEDVDGEFAIFLRGADRRLRVFGSQQYLRGRVELYEPFPPLPTDERFDIALWGPESSAQSLLSFGAEGAVLRLRGDRVQPRLVRHDPAGAQTLTRWTFSLFSVRLPSEWVRLSSSEPLERDVLVGCGVLSQRAWRLRGLRVDPSLLFDRWGSL